MTLKQDDVRVPADVPPELRATWIDNYLAATHGTGRLMLFAGDQKIEHLNDDFHGAGIPEEDGDPEHLFRIASGSTIGVFAIQYGLLSHYGADYPELNYLVKLNSKTHLVKKTQADPFSGQLVDVDQLLDFIDYSGLPARAVGYTIYLGSEHEAEMLRQAAQIVVEAHQAGLLVVFWIYPRGKAVGDEKNAHLIAGACGVALCLGADFVKVNAPFDEAEVLREATRAAGRCGVVCAGGSSKAPKDFLQQLHDQIHIGGTVGNATGRNIHQKPLDEARRMCDAIAALTFGDHDAAFALQVYEGEAVFSL